MTRHATTARYNARYLSSALQARYNTLRRLRSHVGAIPGRRCCRAARHVPLAVCSFSGRAAMLRTAACALRAATKRCSPDLGRARHFAELPDAAGAAPELERLKLQLALEKEKAALVLALEDKKAALALGLEKEKSALALGLEKEKAAQTRGVWETLFGVKRETAQLLNLGAGGVVFVASGAYLVSAMLHDVWAHTNIAVHKAEAASQDVRALMTNAQSAYRLFAVLRLAVLTRLCGALLPL